MLRRWGRAQRKLAVMRMACVQKGRIARGCILVVVAVVVVVGVVVAGVMFAGLSMGRSHSPDMFRTAAILWLSEIAQPPDNAAKPDTRERCWKVR